MNVPHNGATAAATPAPVTPDDLVALIVARAAEFGIPMDDEAMQAARASVANIPPEALGIVANVIRTTPKDRLLAMMREHVPEAGAQAGPPAGPAPTGASIGTEMPGTLVAATAPTTAPAFGAAPAPAPAPGAPPVPAAYHRQFAIPPVAPARPAPAAPVDADPYPDLPGTARMISGMYQLTHAAILAGAYSLTKNGETVQRYRPIVGTVVKKRPRENRDPLYELRLVMPALLADHEGKIVEVGPGTTALLAGSFAVHMIGSLVSFPSGHATIAFRPTHFDTDLSGQPVWHGTVDVFVENTRDDQGRAVPKLVSSESVLGPAPDPIPPPPATPAAARA
jgi:hypothetical protein